LTLDDDGIGTLIQDYENQSRAIRDEALRFTWWLRGGLDYEQAMSLSSEDRVIINKIIEENMETTKKSGLAFF
jgi:hypothetical protein